MISIEVLQTPEGEKAERVVESHTGIATRDEAKSVRHYLREKYGKDVQLKESGGES